MTVPETPHTRHVGGSPARHTGGMTSETPDRTVLHGISSRAWEHPADRGALVALRKLRGFDTVVKRLSSLITERAIRLLLLGSAVRVDSRQFPRLFRVYTEAATVLDVEQVPELYVAASPFLNAATIGLDRPVIVVNSALLDTLDDDELRFIVGHELGHVGSGHAVYRTILLLLTGCRPACSRSRSGPSAFARSPRPSASGPASRSCRATAPVSSPARTPTLGSGST